MIEIHKLSSYLSDKVKTTEYRILRFNPYVFKMTEMYKNLISNYPDIPKQLIFDIMDKIEIVLPKEIPFSLVYNKVLIPTFIYLKDITPDLTIYSKITNIHLWFIKPKDWVKFAKQLNLGNYGCTTDNKEHWLLIQLINGNIETVFHEFKHLIDEFNPNLDIEKYTINLPYEYRPNEIYAKTYGIFYKYYLSCEFCSNVIRMKITDIELNVILQDLLMRYNKLTRSKAKIKYRTDILNALFESIHKLQNIKFLNEV